MDNIEDILRALTDDSPEEDEDSKGGAGNTEDGHGGLFDGMDTGMLIKLMTLFGSMNEQTDNERFLLALRPLLREENRHKVDSAIKMLKLSALLPILRESGLFGQN